MFCTRCGGENLYADQFCRSCGASLLKSGGAPGASSGSARQPYPYSTPSVGQQVQQQRDYTPYPGYQGYPPPQYGYSDQMSGRQLSASNRAVASMILSVISIFTCGPFLSIPGMIIGKMEMNAIRQGQAPPAGETLAKIGFYVGVVMTAISCLGILAWMFLFPLGWFWSFLSFA
jgi:hypothetical protein